MKIVFCGDGTVAAEKSGAGLGQGFVTVAAGLFGASFYDRDMVFANHGAEGQTLGGLAADFDRCIAGEKPDLLTVLVGAEDALLASPTPVAAFKKAYLDLLCRIDREAHAAKLILCEPFLLPVGETEPKYERLYPIITEYQNALHSLCKETGAELVPLQSAFFKASRLRDMIYWTSDGVHPTPAGHGLIAGEWISAAKKLI